MARMLLQQAQAWMADPANEEAKRAHRPAADRRREGRRGRWAHERPAGEGGRPAPRVRRRGERDLMSLRYEIADLAPGQIRDAALDAT